MRKSGRTTRLAIDYARVALENPGANVKIVDHDDTQDSNVALTHLVKGILELMNVDFELKENVIKVLPLQVK